QNPFYFNQPASVKLGVIQSAMIKQAWCSALGLPFADFNQLVHFPRGGVLHMDANSPEFMQQLQIVLDRAKYLAKEFTKQYGDGQRSFGCSR
ncbi:MAG: inovirus-type Gp2 protein, partial [Pseudomonadota bacterium]